MAISGKYYIKKWLPNPQLVHGPDFQAGPPTGGPAGGTVVTFRLPRTR